MSSIQGKSAVVTGGASGIGLAISSRFAAAGAAVAILDFDEEAGLEAVRQIESAGGRAHAFRCDVSD
ncbi:MAG: SDR family NAD(P)-dependent oxidoreductase, partial [Verrucomicrobiota bacterium]